MLVCVPYDSITTTQQQTAQSINASVVLLTSRPISRTFSVSLGVEYEQKFRQKVH
jgi:hypothetical protein